MQLYYSRGTCSLVVRIIINELDLPCEFIAVDLKTKKTANGADYLAINPKGAMPALQDKQHPLLTENAIILQYLADTHQSRLLANVPEWSRYECLEMLNYITTEIHKTFALLFKPNVSDEMKNQFVTPLLESKFNFINQRLHAKDFLMGEHFTLPDAYLFVMLQWAQGFKFDLTKWPNLDRYHARLMVYPSIAKSLAEEKAATTA